MGFEPMNTGFADQRVNHFAIGASRVSLACKLGIGYFAGLSFLVSDEGAGPFIISCSVPGEARQRNYFGCAAVRMYAFTFLKPPG